MASPQQLSATKGQSSVAHLGSQYSLTSPVVAPGELRSTRTPVRLGSGMYRGCMPDFSHHQLDTPWRSRDCYGFLAGATILGGITRVSLGSYESRRCISLAGSARRGGNQVLAGFRLLLVTDVLKLFCQNFLDHGWRVLFEYPGAADSGGCASRAADAITKRTLREQTTVTITRLLGLATVPRTGVAGSRRNCWPEAVGRGALAADLACR